MIKFKNLTIKNFMSVGAVTQAVNLDRGGLVLVLGNNLDLGGDGSRNGTGKTTIINALSYALYGNALTNIKRDNLINKINGKNMLVSLEFTKGTTTYKIERGRRPNVMKLFVNDTEEIEGTVDEAQGENRNTQKKIDEIIGMSHTMFKHICALNTYTEPFLAMKANDQRDFIEELLGITQLSTKAEILKENNRAVKDQIKEEEYKIRSIKDSNNRIQSSIDDAIGRSKLWVNKHEGKKEQLTEALTELTKIDIDTEIKSHALLVDYNDKKSKLDEAKRWMNSIESDSAKQQKAIDKLVKEITMLQEHKCYACGQELHDAKQEEILADKENQKQDAEQHIIDNDTKLQDYKSVIEEIGEVGDKPNTVYPNLNEAYEHQGKINTLAESLENELEAVDPYTEQIEKLKAEGLQQIDYEHLNEINSLKEHQEFLLRLLTDKGSFIRKRIIDQNLNYLNKRLEYYLDKTGLPHEVKFLNDLTVEITELGKDLDFDNLSRGERNRLILGLSWAFRDVYESLNVPLDLMFIDELIDNGTDPNGVEACLSILKKTTRERNKNIFLISHREELVGRVNNMLQVIKENGFTNFSYGED
tara:strand:- start:513 stop:2276 length:1764 start_codon:yes stop_codon:yes gene_type:complete